MKLDGPFGEYVLPIGNKGQFKCRFCGHEFAAKTSVTRVKNHLANIKKSAVKSCLQVPEDVKKKAYDALSTKEETGQSSGAKANVASLSTGGQTSEANGARDADYLTRVQYPQDPPGYPTAAQHPPYPPGCGGQDAAMSEQEDEDMTMPMSNQGIITNLAITHAQHAQEAKMPTSNPNIEQESGTSDVLLYIEDLINCSPDMDRGNNPEEQRNDLQLQKTITLPRNQLPVVVDTCTSELMSLSVRRGDGTSAGKENVSGGSMRYDFLTGELEGKAFKDGMEEIWSWLMKGISSIGIYGMGGVGKSTMVRQIVNRLRQEQKYDVYWITVGHDDSILRLQNLIAQRICANLSDEADESIRASILHDALIQIENSVLILDDLWKPFRMLDVGIPIRGGGCQLIITTRAEGVCDGLNCDEKIKLEPLSKDESWALFRKELGYELSPEIKKIAELVASECDGLPLGIIALAGSMKEAKQKKHIWSQTLVKLKEAEPDDTLEPKVFKILRYSYTRLNNVKLQQCFLYCALYPEDFEINREELIPLLIDEGIIKRKSWMEEIDEGHSMLSKLVNVSLLEIPLKGESHVKMHDLIRDMALQELRKKGAVMVESGLELRKFPEEEDKWTEDLTKVSIMSTDISFIPSYWSPCCPNLSTLLLSRNYRLIFIGDLFFKNFRGLKVLDVSGTDIAKLPDSISDLVGLTGLIARGCKKLKDVPSLAKLRRLKELDLSDAPLEFMPDGMDQLKNLRYVSFKGNSQLILDHDFLEKLWILDVFIVPKKHLDSVKYVFERNNAKTSIRV